ncbi:MAG: class I SAM-dependent methyltransferase [Planctomycetaceae bacterium]|nr:class I SAM-dependent methyltransferase [Planctomycetaceae bacterium]
MTTSTTASNAPAPGHYAARHQRAFFLSFSHNSRFAYACRTVAKLAGRKLLDYGCGDGTFLAAVRDQFPDAVGADIAADQVADCIERFGSASTIRFTTCEALREDGYRQQFDVVCCMEVLEHCPQPVVEDVLDELARLAALGAVVLISVPVETGPTLLAKQFLRRIAGWRGVPGYQQGERYTVGELCSMLLAGPATQIERPVYGTREDGSGGYHGHKGFNWMALQRRIATRLTIERVAFTPWPWLRGCANSQVWFHCRAAAENGSVRN